jgi:hypothetical protein
MPHTEKSNLQIIVKNKMSGKSVVRSVHVPHLRKEDALRAALEAILQAETKMAIKGPLNFDVEGT